MFMKCLALVCLLAATCVSGEIKSSVLKQQQQENTKDSNANMEMNGTKTEAMKSVQVTGFITANGSIYEVEDKNGMGQIEARQNVEPEEQQHQQQQLIPQSGEFICNYGSVVLYSDRPCEHKKHDKDQTDMTNMDNMELVKPTESEHKDKETSASASVVDVQSDDNSYGVPEHKENNMQVANVNKKKTRRGNNKTKRNKNKQQNKIKKNQNNEGYVLKRTRYRIKRPQGQQQQQQQPNAILPQLQQQQQLLQQALRQGLRPQNQNQNQRGQQQATNMKRRRQQQQQQLRRRLQQIRRAQQENAAAGQMTVNQKQRFATPDGLVYEIIHVNEN